MKGSVALSICLHGINDLLQCFWSYFQNTIVNLSLFGKESELYWVCFIRPSCLFFKRDLATMSPDRPHTQKV